MRAALTEGLIRRINEGYNNLEIKFDSKTAYEQAYDGLFEDEDIYGIFPKVNASVKKKIATNRASLAKEEAELILNIIVEFI